MPKTSAIALAVIAFAAGVLADESIKPNGSWWQRIPAARQLGYVEGYNAGRQDDMEQKFCESARDPKFSQTEMCVLFRLRQHTFLNVSTGDTLSTITHLYESPANLPIRWNHAVALSEALASGVAVTESDFQLIRREDAKQNLAE